MKGFCLFKKLKKPISIVMAACMVIGSVGGTGTPVTAYADTASVFDTYDTVFDNYITVDGTKLMDGTEELKFISLNYPQATSDTAWEQANAVKTIRDMGGNVTRTYTIPVTNGSNGDRAYVTGVDENGKLIFNEDALNELDNLLALCNQYGIRVIIPLVDHWHWVGGIDGYVWLANGKSSSYQPNASSFQSWAWDFYSNETCINYFEQMIEHLMNRVNTVSGIQYKDDPAVLCWETGNEIGANQTNQQTYDDVLTAWNKEIVSFIKSEELGVKQLVLDGRMSTTEKSRTDNPADILGAHYYEGNYATRCADDTVVCHNAGYPFILGEFGGKTKASDCIPVFQAGVENNTNGIMMWSLRAHKDGFGYYFHDEDGYWAAYHWPGFPTGDYYGETEIIRSIYAYAQIVNGKAANYEEAKLIPIPAPETDEAPLLYEITTVGDIKWRGVVGGAWYEIQRADGAVTDAETAEWTTIAGEKEYVYDSGRNWEDKSHDCIAGFHDETALTGQTYSYRLRACNESGAGLWSNIVTVENAQHVVKDDLDMIAVSSTDQNPTELRNVYSYDHSANVEVSSSSVVNKSSTTGYIGYAASIPVSSVEVTTVAAVEEGYDPVIYVSKDDIVYTPLEAQNADKTYTVSNLTDSGSYYYVRVYIPGNSKCKLDAITITYVNTGEYNQGGASVASNVMIQDNTFGENGAEPYYIYKTDNLAVTGGQVSGLAATNGNEASIIYKTGDDINAYRVVALVKNGVAPVVEVSFDGIEFAEAPVIGTSESGEYERIVYGDLDVADSTRVVRVTYPADTRDDILIYSVEVSSGTKSIPLADSAPDNTLEDGEYYFGSNEYLKNAYTIETTGNTVIYKKQVNNVDMSSYDSLYAWIAKDNSSSVLQFSLTDANGTVWTSPAYSLSGTSSEVVKFAFADFTGSADEMDLSSVTEFAVSVTAAEAVTAADLELSGVKVYTGNYGVELQYATAAGQNAVVFDGVYVSSSSKVDDFEGYSGSSNLLNGAYNRNTNGGSFDMSLDTIHKSEGSYGLKIVYNYNGTGYAGATKTMDLLNLGGYDGFMLYCESDGSGNQIKIQVETDVSTFSYTGYLTAVGPMIMYMPFEDVKEESWAGSGHVLDQNSNLKSVSIYTNQSGSVTSGTLYFDDIKGANYVEELERDTAVGLNLADGETVTAFPYTISGTAEYVSYVCVTIGEKSFNVPVTDGVWSYDLTAESGVYNGSEIQVKAGAYYPNGDVIAETESKTIAIAVEGNDPEETIEYDQVEWSWDFADGVEGWVFEGFTPWVENGMLVSWSQSAYEAAFSYHVEGIPNGIYTLGNDIKVKSNMNYAYMGLTGSDGITVKSNAIDTEDVVQTGVLLGDFIEVRDNQATVVYTVGAPDDTNGSTFAVGNLKLYKVGDLPAENYIINGDMTETSTEWPNLPTSWDTAYEGGDGWSPIKGENETFVAWASAPYTFNLSQTVTELPSGMYELGADIKKMNDDCLNSLVMRVSVDGEVVQTVDLTAEIATDVFNTFTLSGIEAATGTVTVEFAGDVKTSGVTIDNVTLYRTGAIPEKNYIVNGTMAEVESEWPNLPANWDTAYEGGDGWSLIKGENETFVAWASAFYTFTMSQTVTDLPTGVYALGADIKKMNDDCLNSLVMRVSVDGEVVQTVDLTAEIATDVFNTFTLSGIEAATGTVTVEFAGDVKTSGVTIDNVTLYRTGDLSAIVEPSVVTGVNAVYQDGQVKITWDDNGAEMYKVVRTDGKSGYTTLTHRAAASEGWTDANGLIVAQLYYYRVIGYYRDAEGNLVMGPVSDATSVLTVDGVPDKTVNVAASVNDSSVELTWDAVKNARYYKISRAVGTDGPYITLKYNIEALSYTDSDVADGRYRYKVVGYYKDVDGSWVYGDLSDTLYVTVK